MNIYQFWQRSWKENNLKLLLVALPCYLTKTQKRFIQILTRRNSTPRCPGLTMGLQSWQSTYILDRSEAYLHKPVLHCPAAKVRELLANWSTDIYSESKDWLIKIRQPETCCNHSLKRYLSSSSVSLLVACPANTFPVEKEFFHPSLLVLTKHTFWIFVLW
jgi:hypothetical protein